MYTMQKGNNIIIMQKRNLWLLEIFFILIFFVSISVLVDNCMEYYSDIFKENIFFDIIISLVVIILPVLVHRQFEYYRKNNDN